ncbi:LytTR family DNA-binding domain-containing protein [Pedobacter sp. BMA]|uniref:LytR/AlgR family response regulator transcription factor n=1 Tax=Pedobacter sp. BMA TaxID=1663685 RepID=UPI00064B01A3|nr:LytTR family DNA-binding domain-containing protein [Pedobacter sp. BMA]KLT66842.1 transcriptional regulator [Pedobacter sp. BMA]
MKLSCIVIDDDIYAINGITAYIKALSNLLLIQTYSDPLLALTEISNGSGADILFMDVDMPMISGIELSKMIRQKANKLIFTTSHSKYAYDAFELNADAYLLKPYTFARFAETINRLFPQTSQLQYPEIEQTDDYFFVRNKNDNNNLIKVRYAEIVAVESLQNYVRIYTLNEVIVSYISLSEIKTVLEDHSNFTQAHRSFIIAKNFIEKVEGNTLKLINDLSISLGNHYKDDILEYIKQKTIKTNRT